MWWTLLLSRAVISDNRNGKPTIFIHRPLSFLTMFPPKKIKYPTKKMEKSEKSQVIIVCLTLFFHSFSSRPTKLGGSGNGPGTRRPPPLDPWSPSVARPRTRVGMEVLCFGVNHSLFMAILLEGSYGLMMINYYIILILYIYIYNYNITITSLEYLYLLTPSRRACLLFELLGASGTATWTVHRSKIPLVWSEKWTESPTFDGKHIHIHNIITYNNIIA